jgi:hypothetical protein
VPREGARLSERGRAQLARKGSHVDVSPVMYDQASAFCEDPVAVPVFADEVGHMPIYAFVSQLYLQIRACWHCLKSSIRLVLHHIFSP